MVGRGMEGTFDAAVETVGASRSRIVFSVFRFRFHGYRLSSRHSCGSHGDGCYRRLYIETKHAPELVALE